MDEYLSTIDLRLGLTPRLRILLGGVIKIRIVHRGPVDKVAIYLGADELGQLPKGE